MNVNDGVRESKRNIKVIKALLDISGKTARIGHQLTDGANLRTLESHSSRHNKTDVARAEDNYLAAGHIALHIYEFLRRTCGVNACRTVTCDVERSLRALATAHSKDNCLGIENKDAVLLIHSRDRLVLIKVDDHSVEHKGNTELAHLLFVSVSVLGACELLAEAMETEAVVNALTENAAESRVTLEYEYITKSCLVCRDCRRHTCRAAADYYKIYRSSLCHSLIPPSSFRY